MRTVRERIRSYRERHGLSQAELARQLGISAQYLCDIEKGRKPLSVEVAVALAVLTGWDQKTLSKQNARERVLRQLGETGD